HEVGLAHARSQVGNHLLIGADDGALYSLHPTTGALNWKFASRGGVYVSSPSVDQTGTRIFFAPGDYDANLYCLNLSGTTHWTTPLLAPDMGGRIVVSSPTSSGTHVFLQAAEVIPNLADPTAVHGFNIRPTVFCLNAADGSILWQVQPWPNYSFDNGFLSPIAIVDDKLLVAGPDGSCRVLRASNGDVLGSVRTNQAVLATPLLSRNNLYLASTDGNLYSLTGQDLTAPTGTILSPVSGSTVTSAVFDLRAQLNDPHSGINSSRINLLFGAESIPLVYDAQTTIASASVECPFVYGTLVATLSFYNNAGLEQRLPWSVLVRDPSPLALLSAEAIDEKTVRLTFNAPLASSAALVVGNFSLSAQSGTAPAIAAAAYESPTGLDPYRHLLLTLAQPMPAGVTLTIQTQNQRSTDGRTLTTASVPFVGFTPNALIEALAIAPRQILLRFSSALADSALTSPQKFAVSRMAGGQNVPITSLVFATKGPFTGATTLLITTGENLNDTSAYQVTGTAVANANGSTISFVSRDFIGYVSPTLNSARVVAANGILLSFSDPLFSSTATSLPSYQLKRTSNGTVISLTQAITADPGTGDPHTGVLLTAASAPDPETYTLIASGLFALDGRVVATQTLDFSGDRTLRLVSANAVSPDAIVIRSDTALQFASITDTNLYSVQGFEPDSTPTVSAVTFGDAWGFNPDRSIRLQFSAPLISSRYVIAITQVRDTTGKIFNNLSTPATGYVPLLMSEASVAGNRQIMLTFNQSLATDSAQSLSQYTLTRLDTNQPVSLSAATLLPSAGNASAAVLLESAADFTTTQYRVAIQNLRTAGDQVAANLQAEFSGAQAVRIASLYAPASRTLVLSFDASLTLSAQDAARWELSSVSTGQIVPLVTGALDAAGRTLTLTTSADLGSQSYRLIGRQLQTPSGTQISQLTATFAGYRPALLAWADSPDPRTVRLRFNAPPAPASIGTLAHYRLVALAPAQVLTIVSAKPDPESQYGVLLLVRDNLPHTELEVTVTGLTSTEGAVTAFSSVRIPARLRQNTVLTIEPIDFSSPSRYRLEVSSNAALSSENPVATIRYSGSTIALLLTRTENSAYQYLGEFDLPPNFAGLVSAEIEVKPGLRETVSLEIQPKYQLVRDGIVIPSLQAGLFPDGYRVFFLPLSERLIREILPRLGLSSLAARIRGKLRAVGLVPSVLELDRLLAENHVSGPWVLFTNDENDPTNLYSPLQLTLNLASFTTPQQIGLFQLHPSGEWDLLATPSAGNQLHALIHTTGVYALIADRDAPVVARTEPDNSGDTVPVLGNDQRLFVRLTEPKNTSGLALDSVRFIIDNESYLPTSIATDVSTTATQTAWNLEYRHPVPLAVRTFSWYLRAADRMGNQVADVMRQFAVADGLTLGEASLYPNPVRAGQSMHLRLRSTLRPDHLTITIRDTAGDRVALLVDEDAP
ncbi:MAG TPA: PQQ-binding-like beta-propeller repeat protein, partial [Candidatus Ozemobacteraceae bacterium]|nr:PQQ-binding-like beta-propeller repeat protein [Candidatus Ozemobacteraceae bacterium]